MSQSDKRAVNAVHAILIQRFPKAFPKDYDAIRPLKIDIHADLIKLLPDVDHALLRRALANHTGRDGYLLALVHGRGDRRYDLDGHPAGTVTPEEREEAMRKLEASTRRGCGSTRSGRRSGSSSARSSARTARPRRPARRP